MSATQPNFESLADALSGVGALGEASELHGQLCGLVCMVGADAGPSWVAEALGGANGEILAQDSAVQPLSDLARATWQALEAGDLSLQLSLPADHNPLDLRAAHLGYWCQGFMHGLASAAANNQALAQGVTAEIVEDFTQITRAGPGDEETPEEGEAAYAELVEFVRVSVQLVFEEMHGLRCAPDRQARSAGP